MYSLDVNFLKDRPEYRPDQGPAPKSRPTGSMKPLFIGLAVGLLLPGIVGGLWLYLQQQNSQLAQRQADLDSELQRLQIEQKKVDDLNTQIQQVNAETEALATVFNQIKPWSAILQDVRERIPPGVQITSIQQSEVQPTAQAAPTPAASPGANAAAPASTPGPSTKLEISGKARTFDDVNYFLLTLKRSSFLKNDETQLVSADLVQNPNRLEVNRNQQNQQNNRVTYSLPKVVEYTISTTLNDVPASEILRELDRKGAVGLVTRIRTLQQIQENQDNKQDKGATQQ